ncbi:MAG: NHL repeat-containing protein, partial [Planctomycetota bacterium]
MKAYLFIITCCLVSISVPTNAQTIVNQWPTGGVFAGGLDYDPGTDTIWVADETAVMIMQFDRNGTLLNSFAAPKSLPIGVGVDPYTGNVWIGDESEWVDELTPAGVPTGRSWSTAPHITDVSGLAFDQDTGHIYISQDSSPRQIAEFDPDGNMIQIIDLSGTGSADPDGLGYHHVTTTFFLGEDTGDQIIEVDMAGTALNSWYLGGLGISPEGVGLDVVAGTLFISDGTGNTVFEVADITTPARPYLKADANTISGRLGGIVNFTLIAGSDYAEKDYLLLGCVSGTSPGTVLPGGAILPLNLDFFTDVVIAMLNTTVFHDFLGELDKDGNGTAQLNTTGLGTFDPGCIGTVARWA